MSDIGPRWWLMIFTPWRYTTRAHRIGGFVSPALIVVSAGYGLNLLPEWLFLGTLGVFIPTVIGVIFLDWRDLRRFKREVAEENRKFIAMLDRIEKEASRRHSPSLDGDQG